MLLGAHLSAAGGVSRAALAASELGCRSLQLFLRAPGRWQGKAQPQEEVAAFRDAAATAGLEGAAFAHAPYLLNPASEDDALASRSEDVLVEELERAGRLGLAGVVLHPGSAGRGDRSRAEQRCSAVLSRALARAGRRSARLLLEGTAGAGGLLGTGPEELHRIVRGVDPGDAPAVGVCLDTAHLWGAGYDLLRPGWGGALDELERWWGRSAPDLVHGNDTAVPLGSRRDRHSPPGEGVLGEVFYRRMLADARFDGVPLVIEVPPGSGNVLVAEALDRLRSWSA